MDKKKTVPRVDLKRCKGCSLCVAFCPKQVFEKNSMGKPIVKAPENCIGCRMCEYRCPDYALFVVTEE